MSQEITCEFRLKPGTKWEMPCGEPAGTYELKSMVCIRMNLCNEHRDKVIIAYNWTVEKVEDVCQQNKSQGK